MISNKQPMIYFLSLSIPALFTAFVTNQSYKSIKRPAGASDAVYKQHANTMARKISHQLGRDNPAVDAGSLLNDYVMASTGIDKTNTTI